MITDRQRAKLDVLNASLPPGQRLTVSMVSNLLVLRDRARWVADGEWGVYRGSLEALVARGLADDDGGLRAMRSYIITAAGRRALAKLGLGS